MRIAKMVDVLHRCGAKVKCEIVVKSLLLLVDDDMFEYLSGFLALIKLWVKVITILLFATLHWHDFIYPCFLKL